MHFYVMLSVKVMCSFFMHVFSLQKSTVVQFSPKTKKKYTVVDIWKYMTVADVANAMGKSVGK